MTKFDPKDILKRIRALTPKQRETYTAVSRLLGLHRSTIRDIIANHGTEKDKKLVGNSLASKGFSRDPKAVLEAFDALPSIKKRSILDAAMALGLPAATLRRLLLEAGRSGNLAAVAVKPELLLGPDEMTSTVRLALRQRPHTLEELAAKLTTDTATIKGICDTLLNEGLSVHQFGDSWSIEKAPTPLAARTFIPEYESRDDNTFLFGFTSDNHLGSKYSRIDVLNDLYDHFAAQGVDRVFNAGNWVDGVANFNKHDLVAFGMDGQLQYLAKHYPQRPGIHTYAVAGDDHEGWWCQREGVDIGRYAQNVMREAGRDDWHDVGYMEAFIKLKNKHSGKSQMLHLMHPGGGSSYAVSYTVQKICEGYDGGEKPAVLLAGHYHKLAYNMVRNVHAIQTGSTQSQTPFMRKKKLASHVGGGIVQLRQDPITGAITACRVEFFNYYVQDYYNNRWNMAQNIDTVPMETGKY